MTNFESFPYLMMSLYKFLVLGDLFFSLLRGIISL